MHLALTQKNTAQYRGGLQNGSVAQLAAQETFNLKVVGSYPTTPTVGGEAIGF